MLNQEAVEVVTAAIAKTMKARRSAAMSLETNDAAKAYATAAVLAIEDKAVHPIEIA